MINVISTFSFHDDNRQSNFVRAFLNDIKHKNWKKYELVHIVRCPRLKFDKEYDKKWRGIKFGKNFGTILLWGNDINFNFCERTIKIGRSVRQKWK